jgi:hypothetical protein
VGATVVVALSPCRRVVAMRQGGLGGDVALVLGGHLVLSAVGPLHSLQAHARHAGDTQYEHYQSYEPGGPRRQQTDHHSRT